MDKLDAYVILHISEFIQLHDFVKFTHTSKEYREQLIMDNIQKRFALESQASVSIGLDYEQIYTMKSRSMTSQRTDLSFSMRDNPIVLKDFYKDLYYGSQDKLELEIRTPMWRFHLEQHLILYNDIEDLVDTEFTICLAKTQFAEISMVLFFDKPNIRIHEINISYVHELHKWWRNHYIQRTLIAICITIATAYTCSIILFVYGILISAYLTRKNHPSYFEIYAVPNI